MKCRQIGRNRLGSEALVDKESSKETYRRFRQGERRNPVELTKGQIATLGRRVGGLCTLCDSLSKIDLNNVFLCRDVQLRLLSMVSSRSESATGVGAAGALGKIRK